MNIRVSQGFALPTVLIAGVVAMMVLFTALTASTGVRSALDEQYYQQLAREAAESGVEYAQYCIHANDQISTWEGKTLTPKTNCSGNNVSSYPNYLMQSGNIETTFVVDSLAASPTAGNMTVTGYVNLKRQTDGSAWRSYQHKQVSLTAGEVGASSVAFGYLESGPTRDDPGVFVAGLTGDGRLMTQGQNSMGQLGHFNSTTPSLVPKMASSSSALGLRSVFASDAGNGGALFAINREGDLYGTGRNSSGQLGIGNTTNPITDLRKIDIGSELARSVTNLNNVTFVVTESGKILSAGSCDNGALGRMSGGWFCIGDATTMDEISLPSGSGLATEKIAADDESVLMITSNGRVYAWGKNNVGQLGVGSKDNQTTPTRVGAFGNYSTTRAVDVATDGSTSFILQSNGLLYVTGSASSNMYATSGLTFPVTAPTNITSSIIGSGLCSGKIIDIETDNAHAAVLTDTGDVCTFGRNSQGQLGHGSNTSSAGAQKASLPSTRQAVSIAVGAVAGTAVSAPSNTYAILDNGQVYGTGSNYYGQLGYNSTIASRNVLTAMRVFGPAEPAVRVQTGLGTTIIYTENGRVYVTGNNQHGQIGDGTTTLRRVPIQTEYTHARRVEF